MPFFGTLDVDAALADAPTMTNLSPPPGSFPAPRCCR